MKIDLFHVRCCLARLHASAVAADTMLREGNLLEVPACAPDFSPGATLSDLAAVHNALDVLERLLSEVK